MARNSKLSEVKPTKAAVTAAVMSLNRWNRWLAGFYVVQALLVALLSRAQPYQLQTSYLTADFIASDAAGQSVLDTATAHVLDINVVYLVVAVFFAAALAHAFLATGYRSAYEADLKRRLNKLRWIEYAVSGSLLLVAIALLGGIADLSTLVAIFGLTVLSSLAGLAMELYNQDTGKPNWLAYGIGFSAGFLPAVIFASYVWSTNVYGSAAIPGFIYGVYATLTALSIGFALTMFLQFKQVGKWKDYLYAERCYMMLSVVAKTALVWQIFAGALRN